MPASRSWRRSKAFPGNWLKTFTGNCIRLRGRDRGLRLFRQAKFDMPVNIPILLTWLRVALIPLMVGGLYLPDSWLGPFDKSLASTLIFIVAALTDWIDGFLARRWNQTSAFGAFLDPVADKLMVAGALLVLI